MLPPVTSKEVEELAPRISIATVLALIFPPTMVALEPPSIFSPLSPEREPS